MVTCALLLGVADPARAAVGFGIVPDVASPRLVVGQANVPASLTIFNVSSGAEARMTVTVSSITLLLSCASVGADCPPSALDPGVFRPGATAIGEAGTACAGTAFAIGVVDAGGTYRLRPSAAVVLGPPASLRASCVIDFTVDVVQVPAKDADPSVAGRQTDQTGSVSGVAADGRSGSGGGTSVVTVGPGTVPVATQAAPARLTVGGSLRGTASLTGPGGAARPGGAVTFDVYGPADAACGGPPALSSLARVGALGAPVVSGELTPPAAGTYRMIATYGGDANYVPSASSCADAAAAVVVGRARLAIAVQVTPATIGPGSSLHAVASLGPPPAGGASPTGAVVFDVFGPADPACAAAPVFSSTSPLLAAGTSVVAGSYTPAAGGTYRTIATYGGDGNYDPSASACADPASTAQVPAIGAKPLAGVSAQAQSRHVAPVVPVPLPVPGPGPAVAPLPKPAPVLAGSQIPLVMPSVPPSARAPAGPPAATVRPGAPRTPALSSPGASAGAGPLPAVRSPRAGVTPALGRYDPRSQPVKVVGVEVALFTLLALAGAGGVGLSGWARGAGGSTPARGAGRGGSTPGAGAAERGGGGGAASFDVDYEGVDVVYLGVATGLALGDRSRTWGWPGTAAVEAPRCRRAWPPDLRCWPGSPPTEATCARSRARRHSRYTPPAWSWAPWRLIKQEAGRCRRAPR